MEFDLDKVMAEQQADSRPPFTFKFDGKKYSLPGISDVRAILLVETGDIHAGFAQLLGNDQWERLKASPKLLSTSALVQLYNEYVEYTNGASPGESRASTRSSRSTARPSKPTSKRTTKSTSRTSVRKD